MESVVRGVETAEVEGSVAAVEWETGGVGVEEWNVCGRDGIRR